MRGGGTVGRREDNAAQYPGRYGYADGRSRDIGRKGYIFSLHEADGDVQEAGHRLRLSVL